MGVIGGILKGIIALIVIIIVAVVGWNVYNAVKNPIGTLLGQKPPSLVTTIGQKIGLVQQQPQPPSFFQCPGYYFGLSSQPTPLLQAQVTPVSRSWGF